MTLEHFLELLFSDFFAYANRILDWINENILHGAK